MRTLFLMLVLGNLAFFTWDRYLRAPVDADTRIRQVEITPEKIRILGAATPPAARVAPAVEVPKTAEKAPAKAPTACLEWGAFIGTEIQRAEAAVAESGVPAQRVQRVITELPGHWVVIPAQKTRAEVNNAVEELKARGVTDFSIVTDPPERRNAISLGIFRTEEAAQTLLNALRKKGVDKAVLQRRENFFRQAQLYLREPDANAVAKWNALRGAMPGTDIKAVSCPEK